MDIVITYVDGNDPQWLAQYRNTVGDGLIVKRYRDWGTLKYLFRGIDRHLPYVRKVFLVVASESQVPAWIDTGKVSVVLHGDIIPREYLPTFNSCVIEMFLHRIPDLDERFVYFNDDIFPMQDCPEDFLFPGGLPAVGFSRHRFACNYFMKQTRRSDFLALKALGMKEGRCFIRPQHICFPALRSECLTLSEAAGDEILESLSPLRTEKNYNFYLFMDYLYHKGKVVSRPIPKKHFSLAVASPRRIAAFIKEPSRPFTCINDVRMGDARFEAARETLLQAFEARFPYRSRFEQ